MTDANNLYYMRARFYSPDLRRFINQDILLGNIADGQSLNRYAYVRGRVISRIDPFGLKDGASLGGEIRNETGHELLIWNWDHQKLFVLPNNCITSSNEDSDYAIDPSTGKLVYSQFPYR